jgi:O-antigen/teichoic acid export membrane protein
VTFSAVARAQSDGALLRRLILNIMRFASTVATPAFIGLSALAPVIVPVVFGPKWLAATAAVQILLLVGVRTAAAGFSLSILRGLGHVRTPLIVMAVGVCLSAMLAPALTRFGITFTALAVLVRFLLTWPLASYFLKMATGLSIREQARASAPAQLASALMGVTVALAIRPMAQVLSPWWTIVLGVTLGLVAYGALAAAFDRQGLALVVTEISKRLGIDSRKLGPGLQS